MGKRVAHSSKFGPAGPRLLIDAAVESPTLSPTPVDVRKYTVRLHFAHPRATGVVGQVFNVSLQGELVLENLDIFAAVGKPQRTIVREFKNIAITDQLTVELKSPNARTAISGIQLIRESD